MSPVNFQFGVVDFAVGVNHTIVLKSDGTLWGFGKNTAGQLGNGTTATNQSVPVQIPITQVAQVAAGGDYSLVLKTESLWAMGDNELNGTTTNRIAACGWKCYPYCKVSYFLKTDGSLWAMGSNEMGQLGNLSLSNANQGMVVSH